jgi:hypothetical protein
LITIVYFRHDFVPGFFHSALYLWNPSSLLCW